MTSLARRQTFLARRPEPCALSAQLREGTQEAHAAAEASLDPGSVRTAAGLTGLLRCWRAVWSAVGQAASAPQASVAAGAELAPLAQQAEAWLRSDLQRLEQHADHAGPAVDQTDSRACDLASRHVLAALLEGPAATWGVAYVLRGSRLGGAVMAPQFRAALALPDARGTAFLSSAGTEPGREWVAFRRRLDGTQLDAAAAAEALDAARWTFEWVCATSVRSAVPALRAS